MPHQHNSIDDGFGGVHTVVSGRETLIETYATSDFLP